MKKLSIFALCFVLTATTVYANEFNYYSCGGTKAYTLTEELDNSLHIVSLTLGIFKPSQSLPMVEENLGTAQINWQVQDRGGTSYSAALVDLAMGGHWELTLGSGESFACKMKRGK